MRWVLGISALYHDSAAALLRDGDVVAALQQERFSRVKNDKSFPVDAIKHCLAIGGVDLGDIDVVAYYEDSRKKLGRILATYVDRAPAGFGTFVDELPSWLAAGAGRTRRVRAQLRRHFDKHDVGGRLFVSEHHLSHAASAFYPSPFERAAVLCIDGVGEWATTSAWVGADNTMTPLWQVDFPHSLGLLYSSFTEFCGFKVDSGEYKLMGLAPYGEPRFTGLIVDELVDVKADGSFALNLDYFNYETGRTMTNERFANLFGSPRRLPESAVTQREMDLAASVQHVTEDIVLRLATTLRQESGERNLCMAGGVALNCVANGKLLKAGIFDDVWVQPAAGDAGCALGAAYVAHVSEKQGRRPNARSRQKWNAYLGTDYSDADIRRVLENEDAVFDAVNQADLATHVAAALAEGGVVGWFQGRMEYGPRALGSRSILADPRRSEMQRTLNLKIKNRESFRPFAPAVLAEHAAEWFEIDRPSPYMMFVAPIAGNARLPVDAIEDRAAFGLSKLGLQRSKIPAVTHVDYSARLQTVGEHDGHPLFHLLLQEFYRQTGCPVLINTSFNVRGEPIVENPADAYRCFMTTEMDYLCIGGFWLDKTRQPALALDNAAPVSLVLD